MKRMIEGLTGGYSSSAKVVDGALILSLPDALSPVVWRMDLVQARASALEVRTADDGVFNLILKTPREDVHTIAPFGNRARAVRALMAVSRALAQAEGQMRPTIIATEGAPAPATAAPRKTSAGKWLAVVAALVVLLIVGNFLVSGARMAATTANNAPDIARLNSGASATKVGEPVSADAFLQNR